MVSKLYAVYNHTYPAERCDVDIVALNKYVAIASFIPAVHRYLHSDEVIAQDVTVETMPDTLDGLNISHPDLAGNQELCGALGLYGH